MNEQDERIFLGKDGYVEYNYRYNLIGGIISFILALLASGAFGYSLTTIFLEGAEKDLVGIGIIALVLLIIFTVMAILGLLHAGERRPLLEEKRNKRNSR